MSGEKAELPFVTVGETSAAAAGVLWAMRRKAANALASVHLTSTAMASLDNFANVAPTIGFASSRGADMDLQASSPGSRSCARPGPYRVYLGRIAALAVMSGWLGACGGGDESAGGGVPASTSSSAPTQSPSTVVSTPSSSPPATESPAQTAARLATDQTRAYLDAEVRLYAHPKIALDGFDSYARDQALSEIKASLQKRRDLGQRLVGHWTVTKTWLGPGRVKFHGSAPMAAVDLYVCYDLNDSYFVDAEGNRTPITPQQAEARYAVYADSWPNDAASDWRVGKEYAAGEPCSR